MAPMCPEEVDVFTVPHSRMKELVCQYLDMLTATNFSNVSHLTALLENLIKTFREFIAHEQIENRFIMKKLKTKLRSLSIQNTAVCNCHKDNLLTDMLSLLQDGYKCTNKSDADRVNFGIQLRQALESFTETFLPHMAEEEQVFQPLLMEHFSTEELKQIKMTVIQQHFKVEPEEVPEKCVADNKSSKLPIDVVASVSQEKPEERHVENINNLPDEVLLNIMSNLNPWDLSRCAQVSRKWNHLSLDGSLWHELYPVSWAQGNWDARTGVYEEDSQDLGSKLESKARDEDADIDEAEDWDTEALAIQYQSSMLTSVCKHLLPRVGRSVKKCDLAYSKGLTNGSLYKILSLCPYLEHLDLTQTRVSDLGFKGFKKESCGKKLKHLDLSGCLYITDLTLQRISTAIGQAPGHMTQNSKLSTPIGQNNGHVTSDEKISAFIGQSPSHMTKDEGQCARVSDQKEKQVPEMKEQDCNEEEKKICTKCEENQNESSAIVGTRGTYGRMTHSEKCCGKSNSDENLKQKSASEKKCCGMELKSTCASHDSCPRAGPCQAAGVCNQKCCDIELQCSNTRTQSPSHGQCNNCDRLCRHGDNAVHKIDRNRTSDSGSRVFVGCNVGAEPKELHESPDKFGNLGFEGQRSRTFNNDPDLQPRKVDRENNQRRENYSPDWQGSTIENLSLIDETVGNKIENVEPVESKYDQQQKVNRDLEERTPVDFNPGQTHLPDFLFLPKSSSYPLENEESSTAVFKTLDRALDFEKDIDETGPPNNKARSGSVRGLEFLSLSGCYQVTDTGLTHLTENGGLPSLLHLDLSGCWNLEGGAVDRLVQTAPLLNPAHLYYCDNILDGPYADEASGCQNLQCGSRLCCRCGD